MESAAELCQMLHGDFLVSVFSDQGNRCIHVSLHDIRHIHHELVHADPSQNAGTFTADQHIATVGQASRISIPISHCHGSYPHGTLRHIGTAIADLLARSEFLYIGHERF